MRAGRIRRPALVRVAAQVASYLPPRLIEMWLSYWASVEACVEQRGGGNQAAVWHTQNHFAVSTTRSNVKSTCGVKVCMPGQSCFSFVPNRNRRIELLIVCTDHDAFLVGTFEHKWCIMGKIRPDKCCFDMPCPTRAECSVQYDRCSLIGPRATGLARALPLICQLLCPLLWCNRPEYRVGSFFAGSLHQ